MKNILFLAGAFLLLTSCSNDDNSNNDNDIDFEPLHGEVQGVNNFVARGGYAFYNAEETISVTITNIAAGCESDPLAYELSVSVEVPAKEGIYNNSNVAFLRRGETPFNALNSTVIVDDITQSSISLRIDSDAADDINDIEGSVTIAICE